MKTEKIFEKVEHVTDMQTGQIVEERRIFTKKVDKEKFMMVYLESMGSILKINSPIEYKVLLTLWEMSEFETNRIILVKDIKKEIAERLGYVFKTVENAVSRLSKKNLLIKKGTAIYYLNPKYFFKGSEIARSNAFKVIFNFDINKEE